MHAAPSDLLKNTAHHLAERILSAPHTINTRPIQALSLENHLMTSKIYVGNLPYSVTDASLESNFSEFGSVSSAKVMMDRDTGRSKGFGFVEMASAEVAQAAIKGLHGMSVDGRSIIVNLARPREEGRGSGGYTSKGYTGQRADVGYGNGGHGGGRY